MRIVVLAALAAALAAAGWWYSGRGPAVDGAWERVPASPLTAREQAVGAWTGDEVLVFGGTDEASCPSCSRSTPQRQLRDGAAYDPAARRWRRIADAPLALDFAQVARIGRRVYVLSPERPRAFLAYSVDRDRWQRLRVPPGDLHQYGLVAAGGRLVAPGEGRTFRYDPAGDRWLPFPHHEGQLVWDGERMVAFDCVTQAHDEGVCLTTAAVLEGDRWSELPPSKINMKPFGWVAIGGRLVNPQLGDSNSNRQRRSEPAYPNGGLLDLRARRWSYLPDPPDADDVSGNGVLARDEAAYFADHGFVLDLDRGEWLRIPEHPTVAATGQTVVTAGRSLFTFGGSKSLELLGDRGTWVWTPTRR